MDECGKRNRGNTFINARLMVGLRKEDRMTIQNTPIGHKYPKERLGIAKFRLNGDGVCVKLIDGNGFNGLSLD